MENWTLWLIIALFFAPLHYLLPLLFIFLRQSNAELRRQQLISTAIDCSLSMALAFALGIWLAETQLFLAMGILMVAMPLPYLRIVWIGREGNQH